MKIPTIGRNDPCPCGSGKKFKRCCLGKEESLASGCGATGASAELRQALEGRQFGSLEEVQAFVAQHAQQRNRRPLDEFHGLSPEQMYRMLNFTFTSPELACFPEVLDITPAAPILTLFSLLAEAIGKQGLEPTAKRNLPQKFCREAALIYWGKETYQEHTRYGGINKEDDFSDLHITRLVAELAGLVRKYKGRFILSRDCRKLLAGSGLAAIYPILFRTYVGQFNWAYRDGYPELRFIQSAFLFTLYLLSLYGDAWWPHDFYEDSFLRAFPTVLDEIAPSPVFAPGEGIRNCYTWRTLVHFAGFMGLATLEPVTDEFLCRDYRVKALPLLHEAVQFSLSG
jgi:SEC-C motif